MNKIDMLVQEREQKLAEIKAISEKATTEKRSAFNTEEREKINGLKLDISDLDERIATERFVEENEQKEVRSVFNIGKSTKDGVEELRAKFNVHSAIGEMRTGKFTGVNAEVVSEGQKEMREADVKGYNNELIIPSYMLRAAGLSSSNLVQTAQHSNLLVANTQLVLPALGITRLEGLQGSVDVPSMSEITASYATENTTQSDVTYNDAKVNLAPAFLPATHSFSREYLAQTNPMIHQKTIDQFLFAIEKASEQDVFTQLTGITNVVTASTTTVFSDFVKMESAIKFGTGYVMSRKGAAYAKTKPVDAGSGVMILNGAAINGYKAVASDLCTETEAYFGAWNDIVQGVWGGLIIMEDPYSNKRKGLIDVQVARIIKAKIGNQASFVKMIDVDVL